MTTKPNTPSDPVRRIVEEWVAGYERESFSEDGDPEAFVARVRAIAEEAGPDTNTHRALAGFLERLDLARA